jgi:lipoate-protein ligase B
MGKISNTNNRGYIMDLGLIDYEEALNLQHRLWSMRVEGPVPDLLLVLEHPHVITLGRRGNRSHLLTSADVLDAMKIPLFHAERGGDVTYHGPGQLVVYPILNLKDYGYRLIKYVDQLEEVILSVLRDFGIEGRRDSSNRGIWAKGDKIASIGVAIKRWVSFHGIALNYATDLKYFDLIHPCGLEKVKITTMERVLGEKVSKDRLAERMGFHFRRIFPRNWEIKRLEELEISTKSQAPNIK